MLKLTIKTSSVRHSGEVDSYIMGWQLVLNRCTELGVALISDKYSEIIVTKVKRLSANCEGIEIFVGKLAVSCVH